MFSVVLKMNLKNIASRKSTSFFEKCFGNSDCSLIFHKNTKDSIYGNG